MIGAMTSEPLRTRTDLSGLTSGFEALFQAAPSPFLVIAPPDYAVIAVNDEFLRATMTERESILGRPFFEVLPGDPGSPAKGWTELRASLTRVAETGEPVRFESQSDQLGRTFDVFAFRVGELIERRIAILFGDITPRVQADRILREHAALLQGQTEALSAAILNEPLDTSLGALVRTATDTFGGGVRGAIYLADERGERLYHLVGMPAEYAKEVEGFEVGPESLACGLATYTGEPVLTADVRTDSRWEPWRWLAQRFDYRGCWSFPIHSAAGTLVGTLALYWREPREATARDVQLALLLTILVFFIFAGHRESEIRKQAEHALRSSLAEREALLRELHHRVKNNLQVITSLLEIQTRQSTDRRDVSPLSDAGNRIAVIAAIHELLYQSESLSEVDLGVYARRLVRHVASLYDGSSQIDVSVDGDGIAIDLTRAVPFGLLLNELVSNSYKHAFPSRTKGELRIRFYQDDGHIRLRVTDTGVGLPTGFNERPSVTLGTQLVRMLAKQLGGTVTFGSAGGASVEVNVPVQADAG